MYAKFEVPAFIMHICRTAYLRQLCFVSKLANIQNPYLVILDCVSSMSRAHEIIRTSFFSIALVEFLFEPTMYIIYQADFFQIFGVSFVFFNYIEFLICTEYSSFWYSQKYCFGFLKF